MQLGWSDVAVISFNSVPTPSDIDACASLPLQVHAHADDTDSNSSDTDLDLEWDDGLSETAVSLHGQTLRLGTWARVNFRQTFLMAVTMKRTEKL